MGVKNYRDLKVWQKAMDLAEETYKLVKKLPVEERFELSSQIRRAAVSVPSNIAEGHTRFSSKEYLNFLSIAKGSVAELQTQLLLCVRFGYLHDSDIEKAMGMSYEASKMISSLSSSIKSKD